MKINNFEKRKSFYKDPLDKNKANQIYKKYFYNFHKFIIDSEKLYEDKDIYKAFYKYGIELKKEKDYYKKYQRKDLWENAPLFLKDEYKKIKSKDEKNEYDSNLTRITFHYNILLFMKKQFELKGKEKIFYNSIYNYLILLYDFYSNDRIIEAFDKAYKTLSEFKVNEYWISLKVLYFSFNMMSEAMLICMTDIINNICIQFLPKYDKNLSYIKNDCEYKWSCISKDYIDDKINKNEYDDLIKKICNAAISQENRELNKIIDYKWDRNEFMFNQYSPPTSISWGFRIIPIYYIDDFIKLSNELILKTIKTKPLFSFLKSYKESKKIINSI